ncbi:MAG TPA: cysteine hydrolase [Acidimicrobiales bacterium]|jgi:nicotinamidase-related amidase|nr:cysteine hydrolase [Acidimicrobiales bacterium]
MSEHALTIDPTRTALLLLDFQVGTVSRIDESDALMTRVNDVIAVSRNAGVQVAFVRMAFEDSDIEAIPAHTKLAAIMLQAGKSYGVDSPVTAFDERALPRADDIVVRKTRVGAFSSTDLDQQLRNRGVDTIVVAGLVTSAAVLSSVIDAFDRDYGIYVIADTCADHEIAHHDYLVEKVLPRFSTLMRSSEYASLIRNC